MFDGEVQAIAQQSEEHERCPPEENVNPEPAHAWEPAHIGHA